MSPPAQQIHILIVDDHEVMRTALRSLLTSRPGFKVVGEAASRADSIAIAAREQPDIILLDLSLGDGSGLDFLREMQAAAPRARVIVLTGMHDPEQHRRAIRLGALGLVLKEQAAEVLFKAIEKVHAGEVWLDRAVVAHVLTEMSQRSTIEQQDPEAVKIARLTQRERDIVALICEGLRNKQIAERLSISQATVNHHLTSIFDKLDVPSRLELVVYAYQHGLATPLG